MRAATEYLREQRKNVSGLVGHSKAGSGVILYAAKYDDIPRVVNISGRFDNQRGMHVSATCICCAYQLMSKLGQESEENGQQSCES